MAIPNRLRFYNPGALATPKGYTHAVEARGGRTIYISGQVAMDAEGQLVGRGDFRAQVEQVFANLGAALEAAGAEFSDVVKFSFYVLDVANLPIAREVRDRYVNVDQPPASTAVQVSSLVQPDWLVEVDAIAVAAD